MTKKCTKSKFYKAKTELNVLSLGMACPAASETPPQPLSGMCFFLVKEFDNLEGHFQERRDFHYELKMLVGKRCVFWRR